MANLMDIRYSSLGSVVFSDDLDAGLSGSAGGRFPSSYSAGAALEIFCDSLPDEEPGHFLDSCSLCKRPLSCNRDIFMYRGDTPFCSEECRQEQINIDETIERQEKLSSSLKKRISSSSTSASDYSKEQHTAISRGLRENPLQSPC